MFARCCVRGLLLLCLGSFCSTFIGCSNNGLDSVQVTPTSQALTVGQTAQFTAIGTFGNAKNPTTQNITSSVTWASTVPAVATISAAGIATAVGAGATTITASTSSFNGHASSSATLTVTGSSGGTSGAGTLLSLAIIPSSITVANLQGSGQFLAIGTFSAAPTVRDLTNSPTVTWLSATPNVFPVNNNTSGNPGATAGIVTAYGNGSGVITAEAKGSDGGIQTATATFSCPLVIPSPGTPPSAANPNGTPPTPGSCFSGSEAPTLLETVTVYNEGLNTTGWQVTAPSATGTQNVIHCGPGWKNPNPSDPTLNGSVCVATYPLTSNGSITKVILTAPATPGVKFGGWSYNCAPLLPVNEQGPNSCVVSFIKDDGITYNTQVTVGAIFN